ncbi:ABC transporter permease [Parasalinivibrio latis]|uniref:ABC transporter permease n=1 Tax=Parasalinivibrio latis TaxID=2952610 RepID=UPI0030DE29C6
MKLPSLSSMNGALMLGLLYTFLYAPILYIVYLSLMENSVWPFPPTWTLEWYVNLADMSDFHHGLLNSLLIAIGTMVVSGIFAVLGATAVLKYRARGRVFIAALYLSPLFIAHVLIGISTLMFNRGVLNMPGNIPTAIIANSTYCVAVAFLVLLAQLARYDWRLDEAATVFGASPARTFMEVTLPNIWPALFGAATVAFILSFNNLEISFYNLGATPTLPTIAWGTLRHGIKPELYALASLVNAFIFLLMVVLYSLLRSGRLKLDPRDQ